VAWWSPNQTDEIRPGDGPSGNLPESAQELILKTDPWILLTAFWEDAFSQLQTLHRVLPASVKNLRWSSGKKNPVKPKLIVAENGPPAGSPCCLKHRFSRTLSGKPYRPNGSMWYLPQCPRLDQHQKYLLIAPSKDRAGTLGFRCVMDR